MILTDCRKCLMVVLFCGIALLTMILLTAFTAGVMAQVECGMTAPEEIRQAILESVIRDHRLGVLHLAEAVPYTPYPPATYDPYGMPDGPCYDCSPVLWRWPNGLHDLNLTGVRYAFWSPALSTGAMRSHRSVWVNYWGTGPLAAGSTMIYSGLDGGRISTFSNVPADTATVLIKRGGAVITMGALGDSVFEWRAWIIVQRFGDTVEDSLTNNGRVVHERYRVP